MKKLNASSYLSSNRSVDFGAFLLTATITSKDKIYAILDPDIETKFEQRPDGSFEQLVTIRKSEEVKSQNLRFDLADERERVFDKDGRRFKIVLLKIKEFGTGSAAYFLPEFEAWEL